MVYVALLRGINVGGNNKIDMKQLKKAFEHAGMSNVVTYINSGNIIFISDNTSKLAISHILEECIHEHFGLMVKVLVLSLEDMKGVLVELPETWGNNESMKSDVLFLWDEIDNASVLERLGLKPDIDTAKYVPGAVLWSVDRKNVTKSGMVKIIGTDIYRKVTIRNVNTTRKIYELMLAVGNSKL
jgi:uncharacterized protein (DUF1697 family)